jgi:hypothetical protein
MNTSKEQSQKFIGFKLFGNIALSLETNESSIDLNKTYEILFFPGVIPFGTLTYLGRHDEKKVIVELPEEIKQSSFENICTFLLERNAQLVVKEYGYEKLGNRKLHLEVFYSLKEPIVNVILLIQGKWNAFDYEIELDPYDLGCSVGKIRNSKICRKVNVIMEELINIKKCDIIKVFSKLKQNNFQVSIDGDCIKIDLSSPLKQFIDSLGKPSKYQNPKIENRHSMDAYSDEIIHQPPEEKHSLDNDHKPSKGSMWPIFKKMIGKN